MPNIIPPASQGEPRPDTPALSAEAEARAAEINEWYEAAEAETADEPTPTPLSPEREAERLRIERDELAAAAKRVSESLQGFIDDSTDPGSEALGAQYELSRMLTQLSLGEPIVSETAYLSRFSVTPAEVHAFLASRIAEDVHLRYQQAIGGRAVSEAAKDQRMEAAAMELRKPMSALVYRSAANHIDPLKSGGPYPSSLIRFGVEGGAR